AFAPAAALPLGDRLVGEEGDDLDGGLAGVALREARVLCGGEGEVGVVDAVPGVAEGGAGARVVVERAVDPQVRLAEAELLGRLVEADVERQVRRRGADAAEQA